MGVIAYAWNGLVDLLQTKYRAVFVEDLPLELGKRKLYIVGEGEYRWFAAMKCPCGCGDIIKLNIRNDAHPYWRIIEYKGTVSLEPSIRRLSGCRSHFYLRRGIIRWVR